ncbi:LOW QUALITY PROTEIN: hypothetical protein Cgig2_013692 [Carnegiea gigantea]|uniref:Uncharacterized protein n=1 Tax=Carnegiea gigantea TaxID=171969 RepID=A0A9Q1KDI4_9CARY|nr:LOW QUALITY PROTEIN: hypothetical protein Cgig2_013692 [Carnegiea gigantea]
MADMHPRAFGNWALVTVGPMATDHKWTSFETWTAYERDAKYIVRHFAWDSQGDAFPPLPLPKDFQDLCPSYELAVAEEAAEDYELPELPQVIFYVMLLNEAERLVSAVTKLRWSTFELWVWLYGERIFEARFQMKVTPEESLGAGLQEESSEVEPEGEGSACEGATSPSTDEKHRRKWYNRRGGKANNDWYAYFFFHHGVSSPLQYQGDGRLWLHARLVPLPEDYHILCPCFSLPAVEGAAADFELPKIVQATFYAMLLNEAVELGVVHDFMADGLRSALVGLRCSSFEVWMSRIDRKLREAAVGGPWSFGQPTRDPGSNGPLPPSRVQVTRATWRGRGGLLLLRELHLPGHQFLLFIKEDAHRTSYVPLRMESEKREKLILALGCFCRTISASVPILTSGWRRDMLIIFYAMVIDDAAELGFSRRLTMDCVMWAMWKLDGGPAEAWPGDNG